jgi:hypothetical protein
MVDRRTKLLKLTSRRRNRSPMPYICAAESPIDLGKHLFSKKTQQRRDPLGRLSRPGMLRRNVAPVQGYDVGDGDLSEWTEARFRVGEVLASDVAGERRLSSSTIICAASRAFSVFTVLDDPNGDMGKLAVSTVLGIPQPEARPLASTRHRVLMRSMLARVV